MKDLWIRVSFLFASRPGRGMNSHENAGANGQSYTSPDNRQGKAADTAGCLISGACQVSYPMISMIRMALFMLPDAKRDLNIEGLPDLVFV